MLTIWLNVGVALSETLYSMPEYPEGDLPPPRTEQEVDSLLSNSRATIRDKLLKVVLVAGPKDHQKGEHDYPNWQEVWSRLLTSQKLTQVETAWEFPDQQQIETADVLVFYQRGRWDDSRAAVIDPFLALGGGVVYIHWAIDGRGGELEMAKRIGLASLGGSIRYRHGLIRVDFSHNRDHPISRNLTEVEWVDESYWQLRGDPESIDLLGTGVEEDKPWPLFWTVERGRGRVFVSVPGHFMWTFDDPFFRAVLLRGIAWAGRRPVDRFNDQVRMDARIEKMAVGAKID